MEKFSKLETGVSGYWSGKCDSLRRGNRSVILAELTQELKWKCLVWYKICRADPRAQWKFKLALILFRVILKCDGMDKRKELYESTAAVPALANVGSDFDTCGGSLTGIVQKKKA